MQRRKKTTRPILRNVQYDGEYLNVTDSHRALRINSEYVTDLPKADPFLYNVKDNEFTDGKYPELARLFPSEHMTELIIPNKTLKAIRALLKDVHAETKGVKNRTMRVVYNEGSISMAAVNSEKLTEGKLRIVSNGIYELSLGHDDVSFHVNSGYLSDALLTASKLQRYSKTDEIKLGYSGAFRPFTITDGEMYEMIILPVRMLK